MTGSVSRVACMPLLDGADSYTKCNRLPRSGGSGDTDEGFNHHEEVLAMTYRRLASEERYMLAVIRRQGLNKAQIARVLGRHRSTVSRELPRDSTRADGRYRAGLGDLSGRPPARAQPRRYGGGLRPALPGDVRRAARGAPLGARRSEEARRIKLKETKEARHGKATAVQGASKGEDRDPSVSAG
jgi:Helix-turn-helix domain